MSLFHVSNIKKLCRICLVEGSNISLDNALQRKEKDSLSILWALEKVMSVKIKLDETHPSEICLKCLNFLNISYELKKQFENSQKILREHFANCFEDEEDIDDDDSYNNAISLEEYIILSKEKNFLTTQVDVNDEQTMYSENNEYVGNVSEENLNNEMYFQENLENPDYCEENSVMFEKVNVIQSGKSLHKINKSVEINLTHPKRKQEIQVKCSDIKFIKEESVIEDSSTNLTEDYDGKYLSSLDEELIRAAYNLKHECPGCPKIYSSLKNLHKHKETCVKFKHLTKSNSQLAMINLKNEKIDLLGSEYSVVYECDQCAKFYPSSDELEQHKGLEHRESRLNIFEEFKLEDLSELDQELFKSALLLKYECDTCTKIYSSPDKLEKHKAICEKLNKRAVNKSCLQISPNQTNKIVLSTKPELPCIQPVKDICFDNLSQVERDIFKSALNLQYKCPKCKNFYSSEIRFKRHLENCGTKKVRQNVDADIYSCEICGHISMSRKNDFYHKQTVHEERKYSCEKCGKLFAVKSVLKQHMQTHSKDKTKVICPVCGKCFHYSSGLFYHMKMHRNELNYLCDYCERRFINLNALKRHLATHTGERRYQCRICAKKFKGSAEVRIHELRHPGNKPYHCEYCDKGFPSKFNLQLHLISHKGNITCDWCDKKFLNVAILQLHLKMKHKVRGQNSLLTV